MYNKYKNYFAERGLNIFFTDKAVSISCLNSYLTETQKEKTLCLVASGGKSLWEKLPSTAGENPIDDYTLETIHH